MGSIYSTDGLWNFTITITFKSLHCCSCFYLTLGKFYEIWRHPNNFIAESVCYFHCSWSATSKHFGNITKGFPVAKHQNVTPTRFFIGIAYHKSLSCFSKFGRTRATTFSKCTPFIQKSCLHLVWNSLDCLFLHISSNQFTSFTYVNPCYL